jgi:hypothetical protein
VHHAIIQQFHCGGIADFDEQWPPSASQPHIASRSPNSESFPLAEESMKALRQDCGLDGKESTDVSKKLQNLHFFESFNVAIVHPIPNQTPS